MKKVFDSLKAALMRGEDAALCSIIASSGSTPRGSGAKMAVFSDGSTLGTVGGGAVEHHCRELALEAIAGRRAFIRSFKLTHDQTADIGMICGGEVTVYFQLFSGGDAAQIALLEHISEAFTKQKNTWLAIKITESGACGMGIYSDEAGLLFANGIAEAEILPLLSSRPVLRQGGHTLYVEPLTRAGRVYVFGGGHVAQQLVPLLANLDFAVTVFEDREQFATSTLFPSAERVILGDFSNISARLSVTREDYVVIMTRGHQADFELLYQALNTPACYIGVIGSRQKIASTNKRLMDMGVSEQTLARIHTPIGLPIGAETPEEIAVSVAAELIRHRAGLRTDKDK